MSFIAISQLNLSIHAGVRERCTLYKEDTALDRVSNTSKEDNPRSQEV
jgi:hypothetical protein